MEILLRVAIGAGIGLIGGALAGFLTAILTLTCRRLRNSVLAARGQPGIKDALLPLPFVVFSAIGGVPLGAILGIFMSGWRAGLIGACVPAGLLALISIVGTIWQAFRY